MRVVLVGLCVACVVVFLLDLLGLRHEHEEIGGDGLPGFYAVDGFVSSVALVLAAKQLRRILMRKEDYYDR